MGGQRSDTLGDLFVCACDQHRSQAGFRRLLRQRVGEIAEQRLRAVRKTIGSLSNGGGEARPISTAPDQKLARPALPRGNFVIRCETPIVLFDRDVEIRTAEAERAHPRAPRRSRRVNQGCASSGR